MNINLSFEDFLVLAAKGKLQKGGANIRFGRPVLAEMIDIDPLGNSGKSNILFGCRRKHGAPSRTIGPGIIHE